MSARIKAVVFDIDGTLLDSVDLHACAWVEAFAHFGIETKEAEVRRQIGKGGDQLLPVFVDADRLAREGEAIEAYRSDLFKRSYLAQAKPFPAVKALLSHVRDAGQTVALASSGKADEVENYQKILGITDLVDVVTTSDDADRSKPHPDIFEAVLKKLPGLPKDAVMVIGDTPYDAQAAAGAGLSTIGVLCGGFPEAELSAAGCIAIYRDPQDLLDGYARSPLA
ncbi:putative haloacid dehalogenase family hydrolase [Methylorubrum extorquens]|uniref:Putative haloacid dehalogenase family hydrolase n=1 Tax=Methylorubrum extorquens TaxID=408 RepID=A0A2N9AL56_METEX|nr:HAD family hydrolase [Methylorubrum zatmanii]ARO53013.1 HAD family hydrolase [Methylorubrum zatmanii]SOR28088.1 putative haloacid dehalogenase family hydrolase [Methylorubrum extorquens]